MSVKCSEIRLKSFAQLMTKGKGKDFCQLNGLLSSGNKKVPRTTAIFNMTPAKYCPSFHRKLCKAYSPEGKHVCYAKKAEYSHHPEVLPYRIRQMKFWKSIEASDFVWQFLCINSLKTNPWDKLRFNESGDFGNQAEVNKAEKIATLLSGYGIKCYCYTHRSDLDFTNVRNLIISGSNFQKEGIANHVLMIEDVKTDRPKGYSVCPGDCNICNKCSIRGQKIVIPRH